MALHSSCHKMCSYNPIRTWVYFVNAVNHRRPFMWNMRLHSEKKLLTLKSLSLSAASPNHRYISSGVVLQTNTSNDITEVKNSDIQTATKSQRAKENVKTASYGMVIVVGVGVTCVVLFTVLKELFSVESPTALFQMASDKCVEHPQVQDLLGEPIKAFGEETRRGRRRHVSHLDYVDEQGKKGIRVQFYLQGLRKRGTAQIDAREGEDGRFKTRFIVVTADDLLRTSVVVEDNR